MRVCHENIPLSVASKWSNLIHINLNQPKVFYFHIPFPFICLIKTDYEFDETWNLSN